jgi:hypothetical protein
MENTINKNMTEIDVKKFLMTMITIIITNTDILNFSIIILSLLYIITLKNEVIELKKSKEEMSKLIETQNERILSTYSDYTLIKKDIAEYKRENETLEDDIQALKNSQDEILELIEILNPLQMDKLIKYVYQNKNGYNLKIFCRYLPPIDHWKDVNQNQYNLLTNVLKTNLTIEELLFYLQELYGRSYRPGYLEFFLKELRYPAYNDVRKKVDILLELHIDVIKFLDSLNKFQ